MMSSDGRICFTVQKYYVCYAKYMAAILNCMFYKKTHKGESSTSAKHNQNRKTTISQDNVSRSFTAISDCFCINIDFTIFFSKNKWKNWLFHMWKHKNRHIIYVPSACSCKIIRKYVYFYIRWQPSWISSFWTFSRPLKKAIPFFLDLHDILSPNQVKKQV